MPGEIINHLWQSTLFAIAAGLLTIAFRKNRAEVRYWLWFSASVKFLIPFSLLMSLGSHLEWAPAAREVTAPAISFTMTQIAHPFPRALPLIPSAPGTTGWIPIAIFSAWACGFAAIIVMRFRGWLRIRATVRASTPLEVPGGFKARSCSSLLEPGVVGWVRPVVVLPAGIRGRLTTDQLAAVLAQESCHIRRRDNLTSAIHMIVEAMFWFLPRVWWIGSRLLEERERACDEEVLSLGSEPKVYAEALLNICKLYVESPLACVSGITGSNLKKRIQEILAERIAENLNFAKKLALAVAGMAALVTPVFVGMMDTPAIEAQSAAAATPRFEVASVRPSDPNARVGGFKSKDGRGGGPVLQVEHRRFTVANMNLLSLILRAYDIRGCRPLGEGDCARISGGPDWLKRDGFDIRAKMPDDTPDYTGIQFFNGQAPQLQLMLQALLADRFKLSVHREMKQLPVFVLTIGGKGPKLKKTEGTGNPSLIFHPSAQPNGDQRFQLVAKNSSMQELTDLYSRFMSRPVLDRTGLKGRFDFTMTYAADPDAPGLLPGDEFAWPALFTALQEQLGLKLEATKGSVEILVIDHVERPSEN